MALTGVEGQGKVKTVNIWGLVNDTQTPSYSDVSTTQTPNYSTISDTQTPNWKEVA